jgi:hypothetical protein
MTIELRYCLFDSCTNTIGVELGLVYCCFDIHMYLTGLESKIVVCRIGVGVLPNMQKKSHLAIHFSRMTMNLLGKLGEENTFSYRDTNFLNKPTWSISP